MQTLSLKTAKKKRAWFKRMRRPLIVLAVLAIGLAVWAYLFGGRSLVKKHEWPTQAGSTPLAFGADRTTLVIGGDPVCLYHPASGKLKLSLPTPNDSSTVSVVAVSPQGDIVACARDWQPPKGPMACKAEFWDINTGAKLAELDVAARAFAFAPDGKMLVTASVNDPNLAMPQVIVQFWSLPDFKPIGALPAMGLWSSALAFSPDGKLLAIGQQSLVEIFDVKTMTSVATLQGPKTGRCFFTAVAFLPDGKMVAGAAQWEKPPVSSGVWVWDVGTKQQRWHREFEASMNDASFSADGQTLAVKFISYLWGRSDWVEVWDVKARRKIDTLKMRQPFMASLTLAPDGKRLAVGFQSPGLNEPEPIGIWAIE
jgi:WD40 repeat protein